MAFSVSPLRRKCKAVPSDPMLLTPQHFPVSSGRVALDLCLGEAGSFLYSVCFFCFSAYLYRGKIHLLSPRAPALSCNIFLSMVLSLIGP